MKKYNPITPANITDKELGILLNIERKKLEGNIQLRKYNGFWNDKENCRLNQIINLFTMQLKRVVG